MKNNMIRILSSLLVSIDFIFFHSRAMISIMKPIRAIAYRVVFCI